MAGCGVEGQNVGEAWLRDLVDKVIQYTKVRDAMEALSTGIPRDTEEFHYLEALKEPVAKRLNQTTVALEQIEEQLRVSRSQLLPLQKEKEAMEKKYARLEAAEREVEEKRAELPKLIADIEKLEKETALSFQRRQALERTHAEAMDQRDRLEEECQALTAKLSELEMEMSIMDRTFSLLLGVRPEGFDFDTFEAVQDDLEEKVAEFSREMNEEIAKVQRDAAQMQQRLEESLKEEKFLSEKREKLPQLIEKLQIQVGAFKNLESLEAEAAALAVEEKRLLSSCTETEQKIDRLDRALKSVGERFAAEKEAEKEIVEIHSHLLDKQEEMARMGDPEQTILKIRQETRLFEVDAEAEGKVVETIALLNKEIEPLEEALKAALDAYQGLIKGLERDMEGMLSP